MKLTVYVLVSSLKKQIRIQTSTIIASPSTRQLFEDISEPPAHLLPDDNAPLRRSLLAQSDAQEAHNQEGVYRTCTPITAFKVRDPDPQAVDLGFVFGIRIEVVSRAKFLRPYYVLLNRPYPGDTTHFRVHRHTVPPCIPLSGLAAQYLPPPGRPNDSPGGKRGQDLPAFARSLRREIVRYHHRLGVLSDLRKAAGLGRKATADEQGNETENQSQLVDIVPADAEVKHISLEWADGRTGRLVMGNDGEIVKVVAVGENGRDREAVMSLLRGARRVDDITRRLAQG